MPEQEQQPKKKKLRILCQIIKWIFIVLLGLLLIAGIYFQAPWKVLTLLAIILAALTILPKPARKWFWAGVGVVVIALVIWVFLPDEDGDWRPYTFDKELAELEAARAVPDSENAAVIYNQLLADHDLNSSEPDFWNDEIDDIVCEPWSSKDHPELAEWLKQKQPTIETIMQACQREKCHLPLQADILTSGEKTSRQVMMKLWSELLFWAGNNDLCETRTDKALEKYLCILQIANHIYQQPALIDWLVGNATESLALAAINRVNINADATEENLRTAEEALAEIKHNWTSDWPEILKYETYQNKAEFARHYYEINSKGKIRLSRDPWAKWRSYTKQRLEKNQVEDYLREYFESCVYLTYLQKKLIRAETILRWFIIPSSPQKAGRIIEQIFEKFYAMVEQDFDWKKTPEKPSVLSLRLNSKYFIARMLYISDELYYRIHDTYLRTVAQQRGSRLIIASRRYKNENGRWPESLGEIKTVAPAETFIDPINGSFFVYKLTDDSFTLYSKGKNNIDEGGEYKGNWPEEAKPDDRLIWP